MFDLSGQLSRLCQRSLMRNAGWMLVGQGISLACQGVYFVLLARLLGNVEYGLYAGAAAMVSLLSQYSPLGSQFVLVRSVSRNPSGFSMYWGNSLAITLVMGSGFVVALVMGGPHLVSSFSGAMMFCLAIADCLCAQIADIASRLFQAFENFRIAALLAMVVNCGRAVLAAILLWKVHHGSALEWAMAIMAVSIAAAMVACGLAVRSYGWPTVSFTALRQQIREGLVFTASSSTTSINDNVDKTLLVHFGLNAGNGIYSVAYRVVDICSMPIASIHASAYPTFFRKGMEGVASTAEFGRRILKRTAPLAVLLALFMLVVSSLLPHLLGRGFLESATALRWLCLIPLFRSLQLSAGDALTGAGLLKYRVMLQGAAAVFNFSVNLYLIPHFGWRGAVASSLLTDGMLAVLNWVLLHSVERRVLCHS